jgi:mRNA interferase MazF
MVAPSAGSVVVVRITFTDLSASKLRPAVVLASPGRDDWVMCQVTSNPYSDAHAVELDEASFASGGLRCVSYARPGKLFTTNAGIVAEEVGVLAPEAFRRVVEAVVEILRASLTEAEGDEHRPPSSV